MSGKKYPLVLVCKETAIIDEPWLEDQIVEKVVYNDTEYHSFLIQHASGGFGYSHNITERKASWTELKGNVFIRIYDWMPKWAIAVLTFLATYIISNHKEISDFIKYFISH